MLLDINFSNFDVFFIITQVLALPLIFVLMLIFWIVWLTTNKTKGSKVTTVLNILILVLSLILIVARFNLSSNVHWITILDGIAFVISTSMLIYMKRHVIDPNVAVANKVHTPTLDQHMDKHFIMIGLYISIPLFLAVILSRVGFSYNWLYLILINLPYFALDFIPLLIGLKIKNQNWKAGFMVFSLVLVIEQIVRLISQFQSF